MLGEAWSTCTTERREPDHDLELVRAAGFARGEHVVADVRDDVGTGVSPVESRLHRLDLRDRPRGQLDDGVGVGLDAVGAAGPGPAVSSVSAPNW